MMDESQQKNSQKFVRVESTNLQKSEFLKILLAQKAGDSSVGFRPLRMTAFV